MAVGQDKAAAARVDKAPVYDAGGVAFGHAGAGREFELVSLIGGELVPAGLVGLLTGPRHPPGLGPDHERDQHAGQHQQTE